MNRIYLFAILLLVNTSCRKSSKWEEIEGKNIKFGILNAIYFENLNNGLIGSYTLEKNSKSENHDHLEIKPLLYYTKDGGKDWTLLKFEKILKEVSTMYFYQKILFFVK